MCWSVYIYIYVCMWCNGYHWYKWAWQPEFKSWAKLFAFHTSLIPSEKI